MSAAISAAIYSPYNLSSSENFLYFHVAAIAHHFLSGEVPKEVEDLRVKYCEAAHVAREFSESQLEGYLLFLEKASRADKEMAEANVAEAKAKLAILNKDHFDAHVNYVNAVTGVLYEKYERYHIFQSHVAYNKWLLRVKLYQLNSYFSAVIRALKADEAVPSVADELKQTKMDILVICRQLYELPISQPGFIENVSELVDKTVEVCSGTDTSVEVMEVWSKLLNTLMELMDNK